MRSEKNVKERVRIVIEKKKANVGLLTGRGREGGRERETERDRERQRETEKERQR